MANQNNRVPNVNEAELDEDMRRALEMSRRNI
jgi:hypothetical protein